MSVGDALGKKTGDERDQGGRERLRQRRRESVSLRSLERAETLFGFPSYRPTLINVGPVEQKPKTVSAFSLR